MSIKLGKNITLLVTFPDWLYFYWAFCVDLVDWKAYKYAEIFVSLWLIAVTLQIGNKWDLKSQKRIN